MSAIFGIVKDEASGQLVVRPQDSAPPETMTEREPMRDAVQRFLNGLGPGATLDEAKHA
jgi:hypothetical protein